MVLAALYGYHLAAAPSAHLGYLNTAITQLCGKLQLWLRVGTHKPKDAVDSQLGKPVSVLPAWLRGANDYWRYVNGPLKTRKDGFGIFRHIFCRNYHRQAGRGRMVEKLCFMSSSFAYRAPGNGAIT